MNRSINLCQNIDFDLITVSASQVHMSFVEDATNSAKRTDSPRVGVENRAIRVMVPVEERDRQIPVVQNRVSSGIHIPIQHYPAHPQPGGMFLY